jgi:hypothetical protein
VGKHDPTGNIPNGIDPIHICHLTIIYDNAPRIVFDAALIQFRLVQHGFSSRAGGNSGDSILNYCMFISKGESQGQGKEGEVGTLSPKLPKLRIDHMLIEKIMMEFAKVTGLSPVGKIPRHYLWTDAFAVCNFLKLYRQTDTIP